MPHSRRPAWPLPGLLIILLATSLMPLLCPSAAAAAEARVAVATNFIDTARQLTQAFEQQTGHRLKLSFGSTGKLYSQIEHGAPFDLLLAADRDRPQRLLDSGKAVPDSLFVYAEGQLLLWSTRAGLFDDGAQWLRNADYQRIALANPRTAPYGEAARQALTRLGLWQRVSARAVRGESIAHAFQFVATGNADAGLVARSQLNGWHGAAGSRWLVPAELHAPIAQAAVLLKRAADNPAAAGFWRFLQTASGREMIRAAGYRLPAQTPPAGN